MKIDTEKYNIDEFEEVVAVITCGECGDEVHECENIEECENSISEGSIFFCGRDNEGNQTHLCLDCYLELEDLSEGGD